MKLLDKFRAYNRVMKRATRNKSDMTRVLKHHPRIAMAIGAYESAVFFSSKADARLKTLGAIKASSLVGCPF
ncbi:MAG TPA: hypothetical protein VEL28_20135 [Candidatus Binatia bacterium]|nr:hypothetical protein [Candidatus Binatia bacterium]